MSKPTAYFLLAAFLLALGSFAGTAEDHDAPEKSGGSERVRRPVAKTGTGKRRPASFARYTLSRCGKTNYPEREGEYRLADVWVGPELMPALEGASGARCATLLFGPWGELKGEVRGAQSRDMKNTFTVVSGSLLYPEQDSARRNLKYMFLPPKPGVPGSVGKWVVAACTVQQTEEGIAFHPTSTFPAQDSAGVLWLSLSPSNEVDGDPVGSMVSPMGIQQ